MNKPELITRTLTGVFIGAITLAAIIFSPWSYLVWLCVIALLGTREYFLLEKLAPTFSQNADFPFLLMLMLGATGYAAIQNSSPIPLLMALPMVISLRFLIQIWMVKEVPLFVKSNLAVFGATAYLGIPLLSGIIFLTGGYNWRYILIPVILIWVNDIGAYMIGSQWGKHKIAPSISPGKSIEGTIGGGLATLLAGYLLYRVWPEIPSNYILLLSFTTSAFALAGDLWESALKRNAGVKDSGRLLPGHGGILDRYDSLLFVMPVAALAYFIFVL